MNKIWNKVFVCAFVINMLLQLTTQMMNSTLTSKYADYLGAAPSLIGTISSMFALTALIFKLFSAPAIDTFNRKYVLIVAAGILTVAYIIYFLSNGVGMLMAGRLVQGAGQAFTTTCCLTIASDSLPAEKMSSGIGYFSMAQAIAQSIAPVLALEMSAQIGYHASFAVLACITLFVMFLTSRMEIHYKPGRKFSISYDRVVAKEAIVPALILFLLAVSYCVVNAFLVLYAQNERGITGNIGFFFTIYAITLLFSRPFIGRMADRFGTTAILLPSLCCFAGAFWLISIATTLPMFFVAAFISAFGYGGSQPAIQAVAMKSVSKERRGAASCTSYIGTDTGNLLGGTIAGLIVQTFGYVHMWRVMTIPLVLTAVAVIMFTKQIHKIEDKTK